MPCEPFQTHMGWSTWAGSAVSAVCELGREAYRSILYHSIGVTSSGGGGVLGEGGTRGDSRPVDGDECSSQELAAQAWVVKLKVSDSENRTPIHQLEPHKKNIDIPPNIIQM